MTDWPLDIDVVTAVHSPERPIERAVRSVLEHTAARIRVTVVVHNTDPEAIKSRLGVLLDDPRLRIVSHEDSFRTPAGPKNLGLDLASAEYVAMLDSDDTLEPGALDAWLAAARNVTGGADAVIAPTTTTNGYIHPSPPVRWHRLRASGGKVLNPHRDRLVYRASPLGLIGRRRFSHVRFASGIPTGEDQPLTAELWFTTGAKVVFPIFAPRYLEHHDQHDRVTGVKRSVADEFLSLDYTLAADTPWSRDAGVRTGIATKLIRVHLFDALRARIERQWTAEDAGELAKVAERLVAWAPRSTQLLARPDAELLRLIRDPSSDVTRLKSQLRKRQQLRSWGALLPHRLSMALHPHAPLRFHLSSALVVKRVRRRSIATV